MAAGVGVGVGSIVDSGEGVSVSGVHGGVGSGVSVGSIVGLGVSVADGGGVGVAVGVGVELGTAAADIGWAMGAALMAASAALTFVSVALPVAPPGFGSRLDDAGRPGRALDEGARRVSPAERSMTPPPITRSTALPPVADSPPLYCPSAAEEIDARRVGHR